jgi:hypothetical protein
MRKTLLVAILVATAACGTYHFPGQPPGGTGIVSGQVMMAYGCGLVGPGAKMCVPAPVPQPDAQPAVCPPGVPIRNSCGATPVPGLELDFTNGATTSITTTDSTGSYSIELATGTWTVGTKKLMRIISGPTTVTITAGASIVANYFVQSGIGVMSRSLPANPPG